MRIRVQTRLKSKDRCNRGYFILYVIRFVHSDRAFSSRRQIGLCIYNQCFRFEQTCFEKNRKYDSVSSHKQCVDFIIIYFISISKTNDNNKAPEQPIDMRMKRTTRLKYSANSCPTTVALTKKIFVQPSTLFGSPSFPTFSGCGDATSRASDQQDRASRVRLPLGHCCATTFGKLFIAFALHQAVSVLMYAEQCRRQRVGAPPPIQL